LIQLEKLARRLQPEFFCESRPDPPVGSQRVGLPTGSIQRRDQQAPESLPQRVNGDQGLQFPHDPAGVAGIESPPEPDLVRLGR
jgi:hypothetical protein